MATFTRGTTTRFQTPNVTLTNNVGLAKAELLERLARTIAETGEDIARQTRQNMTPHHFYDTGMSQDETRWEQLGPLHGQVHIPSAYAAYPEFGTRRYAARPALTPAVMLLWPSALHRHWAEDDLPALKPFGGVGPINRSDRRTGRGYA
jgi:hypothetical protein